VTGKSKYSVVTISSRSVLLASVGSNGRYGEEARGSVLMDSVGSGETKRKQVQE
jgi:hypothetical protein